MKLRKAVWTRFNTEPRGSWTASAFAEIGNMVDEAKDVGGDDLETIIAMERAPRTSDGFRAKVVWR
jgi:hypothetical protein